jgi:hypothetical protein
VARVVSAATGEPLGTAAEEAARLLDLLNGWFDARTVATAHGKQPGDEPQTGSEPHTGGGPHTAGGPHRAGAPHTAGAPPRHGTTCRACPLCRGLAYLQESHPDVLSHLTDAAAHLVAAVQSLTQPGPGPAGSAEDAGARGAQAGEDRPPASRAVRIDVQPDLEDRANSASSEQEPAP